MRINIGKSKTFHAVVFPATHSLQNINFFKFISQQLRTMSRSRLR